MAGGYTIKSVSKSKVSKVMRTAATTSVVRVSEGQRKALNDSKPSKG